MFVKKFQFWLGAFYLLRMANERTQYYNLYYVHRIRDDPDEIFSNIVPLGVIHKTS